MIMATKDMAFMTSLQEPDRTRRVSDYLKCIFQDKVVIVGVGNIFRGDDGFGPALVERLKGKVQATCIDAGTVPENYIGVISREKADTVLLIDAAHLDIRPGEYDILEKKDLVNYGLTTHDISPRMLIEHLERETQALICMLAVQPAHISYGVAMSDSVEKALEELSELIKKLGSPGR